MMQIGYARVSTHEQTYALQQAALTAAGCERVFTDTCSGSVPGTNRPGLQKALAYVRPDDVLVVWRLDRLGRSLSDLVAQVTTLQHSNIGFRSLQENIDTTSATGTLVCHLFAALAEFERDLIRERVQAGLQAARARGRKGGRPPVLEGRRLARAAELMRQGYVPVSEIARIVGVSRSTLYRHLRPDGTPRRGPGPAGRAAPQTPEAET